MIAAWLALTVLAPPGARPPEWEAIQRRLAQDRLRVRFLRREELTIRQGIKELDRALSDIETKVAELAESRSGAQERISELDARVAEIEERLGGLRSVVGKRAASMLRMRRTSISSLVARSVTPADARRFQERFARVLDYDKSLIAGVRDASLQEQTARAELERELATLVETTESLSLQSEEARALREERASLLEAVSRERRSSGRLLSDLLKTSRRLGREIGVVRGDRPAPERAEGGFAAQRGRLPWPVSGTVEAIFGKVVDPRSGMVLVKRGVDIRAPQSALVRSVFDGTVAYASRLSGRGRVLIVDHETHYSVYCHLEAFQVRVGQRVNQYQVIGLVGDSDSSKGAFLYFELRRGAEAVDPLEWLAPS